MTIKECERCGVSFETSCINKRFCSSLCRQATFLEQNREDRRTKQQEWRRKNADKVARYSKEAYDKKRHPKVKLSNDEKKRRVLFSKNRYYAENREKILVYQKKWKEQNKDNHNKSKERWRREHYKSDPQFRMSVILRKRFAMAVKNRLKGGSAVRDLGCSIPDFVKHIEGLFEPWMNWDNHGNYDSNCDTWQIDHIIPLFTFDLTNPDNVKIACNYRNLRPLKTIDNLKRGKKGYKKMKNPFLQEVHNGS